MNKREELQRKLAEGKQIIQQKKDDVLQQLGSVRAAHEKASELANTTLPEQMAETAAKVREIAPVLIEGIDQINHPTAPPRLITAGWNHPYWLHPGEESAFSPDDHTRTPGIARIGDISFLNGRQLLEMMDADSGLTFVGNQLDAGLDGLDIPALVPVRALSDGEEAIASGHVALVSSSQDARAAAVAALQSLALRLFCTFPSQKLRAVFIDPVSVGSNFAFKDLPDNLSGPRVYTRSDDVREQLRELTLHVEQVVQKYLSADFQTLEEFNSQQSFIQESYRYLYIADFPAGFDNQSFEDLKTLLTNGARAGVYVMLHVDMTLEKPRNFDYEIIESQCTVISSTEHLSDAAPPFVMKLHNYPIGVHLDAPPPIDQFRRLVNEVAKGASRVKLETVPFSAVLYQRNRDEKGRTEHTFWGSSSATDIRAAIGVSGARDYIEFRVGSDEKNTTTNALLAGRPGSGKSYTLHAIINSLVHNYSPDELSLYLLDYKEGVEFQTYIDPLRGQNVADTSELDDQRALPHAKVVSMESDREFGMSVLKHIQEEIETRGRAFNEAGVSELRDFREKRPDAHMPRMLVIIDEFQYMFLENDEITRQLNQLLEDVARRGRSFGIHLLLATQSPNVVNMSRGIYSFIDLRMAHLMDTNTAAAVLEEGNIDSIKLVEKPGQIIYNSNAGRKDFNVFGRIADMSPDDRPKHVLEIHEQTENLNYQRREPLIVFNGTRPTRLHRNPQLSRLMVMNTWLPSRELNKQVIQVKDWIAEETPAAVWLGEASRLGNHTMAIFRRRARSNMLLIGQSEELVFGILSGVLVSLVHDFTPGSAEFAILDLGTTDSEDSWSSMSTSFRATYGKQYSVQLGKRVPNHAENIERAETIIDEVYETLQQRKAHFEAHPDDLAHGSSLFMVCAIGALSRIPALRPVMGTRKEEASDYAVKLLTIASEGPEVGIHVVLWLESMKTYTRLTADDRHWLTYFDLRVGLTMPGDDSRLLFNEISAQNLHPLRAYFHDEAQAAGLEKFKPYAVLQSKDWSTLRAALNRRMDEMERRDNGRH